MASFPLTVPPKRQTQFSSAGRRRRRSAQRGYRRETSYESAVGGISCAHASADRTVARIRQRVLICFPIHDPPSIVDIVLTLTVRERKEASPPTEVSLGSECLYFRRHFLMSVRCVLVLQARGKFAGSMRSTCEGVPGNSVPYALAAKTCHHTEQEIDPNFAG
jgi:hypothetical protein